MQQYYNDTTGENILLKPTEVWFCADAERLQGHKNTTIYMHYSAWIRKNPLFDRQCALRNISIEVVY